MYIYWGADAAKMINSKGNAEKEKQTGIKAFQGEEYKLLKKRKRTCDQKATQQLRNSTEQNRNGDQFFQKD